MIHLQEVHFYLADKKGNKLVFVTEIQKADNGQFSAWTCEPRALPESSFTNIGQSPLNDMFDVAVEAVDALINNINTYAGENDLVFLKVNNPCNCEFVSVDEQKELLNKNNINAQVTVNNPPTLEAP